MSDEDPTRRFMMWPAACKFPTREAVMWLLGLIRKRFTGLLFLVACMAARPALADEDICEALKKQDVVFPPGDLPSARRSGTSKAVGPSRSITAAAYRPIQ